MFSVSLNRFQFKSNWFFNSQIGSKNASKSAPPFNSRKYDTNVLDKYYWRLCFWAGLKIRISSVFEWCWNACISFEMFQIHFNKSLELLISEKCILELHLWYPSMGTDFARRCSDPQINTMNSFNWMISNWFLMNMNLNWFKCFDIFPEK